MIQLAIVVEGETEERFVKHVLGPHLLENGVAAVPIQIGTGRRMGQGGNVNVDDLAKDLSDALDQFGAATSLVDLYGFRCRKRRTAEELQRVIKKKVMEARTDRPPLLPYVQAHEFEGLLFSDPEAFRVIRTFPRSRADEIIERLRQIRVAFPNPEDINDSPVCAPSKRLECIVPSYSKTIHGIAVAREIGIRKIGEECPRFCVWLHWMEGLANDQA